MSDQASVPLRGRPIVDGFFEKRTSSIQYVVADPETKRCAIIDPVHDFDPKSGGTATHSADALLAHVERKGYTHRMDPRYAPHADHFSTGGYLKDRAGVPTGIGEKVVEVQKLWKELYNCQRASRRTARNGTGCSPTASASRSATWMSR